MKTNKYIRPILIVLLITSAFFGLILIGAGSHGNISMKNKETAVIVYGAISFMMSALINGISMRKNYSVIIGFMSLTLNLVSCLILMYYLIYSINFNIDGGHFPILGLIIIGIEILMSGIIIKTDLKQLYKNWLQQRV